MSGAPRDNKTFETKVSNLIAATRHLQVPQILLLRRLTMADPESRKWASDRQLTVVFNVILAKALERIGIDAVRDARQKDFQPLLNGSTGAARDEDFALLSEIAQPMLGNPTAEVSEHEAALEKLLAMGPAALQARTVRQQSAIKEPPPLFAAQLGPDSARLMPTATNIEAGDEKPFTDFPTLFDDTLCGFSRKILALFQVKGAAKPGRLPFILAPEFGVCYEEVLRRFVLPPMKASRHIQQLGMSYNWAEVGGNKLIDIIQGGEVNNPVLHNWDTRWASFRAPKGKKPKPEDNPWPIFREDATRSGYEPPTDDHLALLQDIIRFEADAFAKAWRELSQLYEQEYTPNARQEQAREGAFRDGLMKWASKLPEHVGEFLSMKSYFLFPRIDGHFMRRLLNNFGRNDAERRRAAPFLAEFVQNLQD